MTMMKVVWQAQHPSGQLQVSKWRHLLHSMSVRVELFAAGRSHSVGIEAIHGLQRTGEVAVSIQFRQPPVPQHMALAWFQPVQALRRHDRPSHHSACQISHAPVVPPAPIGRPPPGELPAQRLPAPIPPASIDPVVRDAAQMITKVSIDPGRGAGLRKCLVGPFLEFAIDRGQRRVRIDRTLQLRTKRAQFVGFDQSVRDSKRIGNLPRQRTLVNLRPAGKTVGHRDRRLTLR